MIVLQPIASAPSEKLTQLVCEEFIASSVLHQALGITAEEYESWFRKSVLDKIDRSLSFVAVDTANDRLVACILACEFSGSSESSTRIPQRLLPVSAILERLAAPLVELIKNSSDRFLLVDIAVVSRLYRGKGVYKRLRQHVQENASKRGFRFVVGELSSSRTQQYCVSTLGHQVVAELAFAEFEFQGTRPFDSIDSPATLQLVVGKLD